MSLSTGKFQQTGKSLKKQEKQEKQASYSLSGRVGRLPLAKIQFYQKVSGTLSDEDIESEDRELFMRNVVQKLCHESAQVSRNQTVSVIVEMLITHMNSMQLLAFLKSLEAEWLTLITDRIASHVLQSALKKCFELLYCPQKVEVEEDEDELEKDDDTLVTVVLRLCSLTRDRIETFALHQYASHVLRGMIQLLSGVRVSDQLTRSEASRKGKKSSKYFQKSKSINDVEPVTIECDIVPPPFIDFFKLFVKRVFGADEFQQVLGHALGSPLVQVLLLTLKEREPELCHTFCAELLKQAFPKVSKNQLALAAHIRPAPALVNSAVSSRLVEYALQLANPELLSQLLGSAEAPGPLLQHLVPCALTHPGQFVIAKLLHLTTAKQFSLVLDALVERVPLLWNSHHSALLTELASACVRFHYGQKQFFTKLLSVLEYDRAAPVQPACNVVRCLAYLRTYSQLQQQEADLLKNEEEGERPGIFHKVTFHGSKLIQSLFGFGNVMALTEAILCLGSVDLLSMGCDPCASHILEAFLHSEAVAQRSKDIIWNKLKEKMQQLSLSCHGSRIMDTLWGLATPVWRKQIVQTLAPHVDRLQASNYGKQLCYKMSLRLFSQSEKAWEEFQQNKGKKRKLVTDFIQQHEKKGKLEPEPAANSVEKHEQRSAKLKEPLQTLPKDSFELKPKKKLKRSKKPSAKRLAKQ